MDGYGTGAGILLLIIIICYAVAACATYCVIGNEQDNSQYANFGYLFSAGLFAFITAIASTFLMPETDYTIAISVIMGVIAIALSTGALATASIKH